MVTVAPACRALLSEASRRWPDRRTSSDGLLPSREHQQQNPTSDHDLGNAVDLSHDPAAGCDAHALIREIVARRDPRVKYAISNGRIWSAARAAEGWRRYDGSNPHTSHAHLSIYDHRRDDVSTWFRTAPKPPPAPPVEDDMTDDERKALFEVRDLLRELMAPRRADKTDANPTRLSLADLYTKIERDHA